MSNEIFIIHKEGKLIEMSEQQYDSEALLQKLLADYPKLLAGGQIDSSSPRNWLLIKREMGIPSKEEGADRWSVDHLFLDQDAIPTLVEVKRSSDTRIRREVVGQMLDYAANAVVYWPVEQMRAEFEKNNDDPDEQLAEFLGEEADPEEFWQRVKTNLQAGKVRMLFVADLIPSELRRIVEFLNQQMDPAEVLAVEIKQFVGEGMQTLVPRVIGQTAEAEKRKGRAKWQTGWDVGSFFQQLGEEVSDDEVEVARKIVDWAKNRDLQISCNRSIRGGSVIPGIEHNDVWYWPFSVQTKGRVVIQLMHLVKHSPFDNKSKRTELLRRLNMIPKVDILEKQDAGMPAIPLSTLRASAALKKFLDAMAWLIDEIQAS